MLSKKTKYGIKALTFIARNQGDVPVQVGVIANHEQIPQKFLENILLTTYKTIKPISLGYLQLGM